MDAAVSGVTVLPCFDAEVEQLRKEMDPKAVQPPLYLPDELQALIALISRMIGPDVDAKCVLIDVLPVIDLERDSMAVIRSKVQDVLNRLGQKKMAKPAFAEDRAPEAPAPATVTAFVENDEEEVDVEELPAKKKRAKAQKRVRTPETAQGRGGQRLLFDE